MKKNAGLTLIELLIFFTIAAGVGVLLVAILFQSNRLFLNESSKVYQGININDANSQITEALRSTSQIASSYTDGVKVYTSGDLTIVLQVPSVDSSGSSIANTYDYFVITKDASKEYLLKKYVFPNAASTRSSGEKILSNKLSFLQFSYLDDSGNTVLPSAATRINFRLNLQDKLGVQIRETSTSGQVNIRNN